MHTIVLQLPDRWIRGRAKVYVALAKGVGGWSVVFFLSLVLLFLCLAVMLPETGNPYLALCMLHVISGLVP